MCCIFFICLRLCLSIWTAPQQFLLGNPHQKPIHHDTQYQTGPLYQMLLKALPCYHHENLWGHLMFSQAHHYISSLPLWAKKVITAMPSSQTALRPSRHLLLKHLLLMAREGICHHHRWHKKWTFIPLLGHLFLHDKALLNIFLNSLQNIPNKWEKNSQNVLTQPAKWAKILVNLKCHFPIVDIETKAISIQNCIQIGIH